MGADTVPMVIMKSINFEFLRPERPVLADLAGFAETYAHSDARAMVKVRVFPEDVVDYLYHRRTVRAPTLCRARTSASTSFSRPATL